MPNVDIRIKCHLARLQDDNIHHIDRLVPELTTRLVPVGEIVDLYWSATLFDKQLLESGVLEHSDEEQLTLNLDRSNIRVFQRGRLDPQLPSEPIIPVRSKWRDVVSHRRGLFLGIGIGDDPYAVIIPCYEIFRFFYATSSNAAVAVLRGDFLNPDERLWSLEDSWNNGKIGFIYLRNDALSDDAPYLARFAFDPYALKQAQEIFLYAAGARQRRSSLVLRALPPIQGEAKFTLVGRRIGHRNRLLVTRMLECSYDNPIDVLYLDRDNPGTTSSPEPDPGKRQSGGVFGVTVGTGDPTTLVPGKRAPLSATRTISAADVSSRFPTINSMPVIETPHENKNPRKKRGQPRPVSHETFSVVPGTSSASLVGRAVISGKKRSEDLTPKIRQSYQDVEIDALLEIRGLLDGINVREDAKVTFIPVLDTAFVGERRFSIFSPHPSTFRYRRKWRYIDSELKDTRLVLVAKVTRYGLHRYVVEIQQKTKGELPTFLVWNRNESDVILEQDLSRILKKYMEADGKDFPKATPKEFHCGRLKHTTSIDDAEGPEKFLARIFTAVSDREKSKKVVSASGGEGTASGG